MKMGKRIKNVVIGITAIVGVSLVGLTLEGFPLVDIIKVKMGLEEKKQDNIKKDVTYEKFMARADEILSREDVLTGTDSMGQIFSCSESDIYCQLFLFNIDCLTPDAVKQLMEENIIDTNMEKNVESAMNATAVIEANEESLFCLWEEPKMKNEDFCLDNVNLNLVKYVCEKSSQPNFYQDYHEFSLNRKVFDDIPDDNDIHLNKLKYEEYPMSSKYILESTYTSTRIKMESVSGKEENFSTAMNDLDYIIGGQNPYLHVEDSNYDFWYSIGVTQVLEKYLLSN